MRDSNTTFRDAVRAIQEESLAGEFPASVLLKLPAGDWIDVFDSEPSWLRLGTLEALLRAAHDALDVTPRQSLDIAAFVITAFDRLPPSEPPDVIRRRVQGIAWKEKANALWSLGRYPEAADAVEEALAMFADDVFALDRAVATLVDAMIRNAMGEPAEALRLLEECERTFAACCAARRHLQALQLRGMFLYDLKRYDEARCAWIRAEIAAELLDDRRDWARVQHNLGACAMAMNELALAREYFLRAAEQFTALGMETEISRAQSRLGEIDLLSGRPATANEALHTSEEAFRARGMQPEITKIQAIKVGGNRS